MAEKLQMLAGYYWSWPLLLAALGLILAAAWLARRQEGRLRLLLALAAGSLPGFAYTMLAVNKAWQSYYYGIFILLAAALALALATIWQQGPSRLRRGGLALAALAFLALPALGVPKAVGGLRPDSAGLTAQAEALEEGLAAAIARLGRKPHTFLADGGLPWRHYRQGIERGQINTNWGYINMEQLPKADIVILRRSSLPTPEWLAKDSSARARPGAAFIQETLAGTRPGWSVCGEDASYLFLCRQAG